MKRLQKWMAAGLGMTSLLSSLALAESVENVAVTTVALMGSTVTVSVADTTFTNTHCPNDAIFNLDTTVDIGGPVLYSSVVTAKSTNRKITIYYTIEASPSPCQVTGITVH